MFKYEIMRDFYNSLYLAIIKKDKSIYNDFIKKLDLHNDDLLIDLYDELYDNFDYFLEKTKLKNEVKEAKKEFKYKIKGGFTQYYKYKNFKFAITKGMDIYFENYDNRKIQTTIKLAKSGYNYLQIKKEGVKKIITIFETQDKIFDFIYEKLNITHNGLFYDLNTLESYCNKESYQFFDSAYEMMKDIKYDEFGNGYAHIDENELLYNSLCKEDFY